MAESPTVLQQVRQALPAQKRVLVAVSGGLDSMVLLHACHQFQQQLSTIEVAHVDHGLREESASDARFVAQAAARYGLPFHLLEAVRGDTPGGVEAWGRAIRYEYFARILEERSLDVVLTAHHAHDLAETVLMRFLANREPSSIHGVDWQRRILRPLLTVRREQLEEYATSHNIEFRQDCTNADQALLRNRYRHTIIPYLERELSSDLTRILSQRAISLEDDASALEEIAREKLAELANIERGGRDWLRKLRAMLQASPQAVAWRIVERILAAQYGDYYGRRTSLRVLHFLLGAEQALEIPGGHRLCRTGGGIEFS